MNILWADLKVGTTIVVLAADLKVGTTSNRRCRSAGLQASQRALGERSNRLRRDSGEATKISRLTLPLIARAARQILHFG
jgi:hypothetical protein